ncbi:protein prenylyltransferase [Xylariaceae sp. FL0016]|nr:protein prenylyltransferase [Xylariaceae sp. FL0016]
MPAKNKGACKAKEAESAKPTPIPVEPKTVREEAWSRYWATNPHQKTYEEKGIDALSPSDRQTFLNLTVLHSIGPDHLSRKAQKEFWKQLSEANAPLRSLPRPREGQWGRDKHGRDIGDYNLAEFKAKEGKLKRLCDLTYSSQDFASRRAAAELRRTNPKTQEKAACSEDEIKEEKERRIEMATLKQELYGVKYDMYSTDPEWDDVTPIPQVEPEGALAAIAYPEDYADSMSYLRAIMAAKERSPRCLRLTERVISMNPAHYTVWLYRFEIIHELGISIPEELQWLNDVSLTHLKNYQIWHHRQLLMDHHYPSIADDQAAIDALATSERRFITLMLDQDTKNYHVWSYRQWLVRKLGMWGDKELISVNALIDSDVRNNSAWSHRFFLVFSDPAHSTPDSHATERDPKLPAAIVDREIAFAKEKIELAPQNQSPWNYLRGALVKGGRELGEVRGFCEGFVQGLGEENEVVKSSHALDLVADIYKESGEKEKAELVLRRLGEKWDPIRKGYWEYRKRML